MFSISRHFQLISLKQITFCIILLGCFFPAINPLHAVEGGISNFIPVLYGDTCITVTPPESNFFLRNETHHYSSKLSADISGLTADYEMDYTVNYLTGVYFSDFKILGARYAIGAMIPYTDLETSERISFGGMELSRRKESQSDFSDIAVMPLGLFWQSDKFHYAFCENIVIPTGTYDSSRIDNMGLNYYSLNTTFLMTYLDPDKGHDFSFALGHFYNTENDDTDYKSGQEMHVNVMLNQFFSSAFGLGLHGFYYKQITGDSGSGAVLGSFKGELIGIGPAIISTFKIKDVCIAASLRWFHEFEATNHFKGDHVSFSISALF